MIGELSHSYVIRMHSVDTDSVWVRNHNIEARRVEGDRLDLILQLFDDLEGKGAWVRRVAPDHEGLIRSSCRKDRLLHARCYGCHFLAMERNGQE